MWGLFSAAAYEDDRTRGVSFILDITERKRAEEALHLSEEKYGKTFASNPAAISLTRLRDGLIIDVNETWQTMFGFSREEAVGRTTMGPGALAGAQRPDPLG